MIFNAEDRADDWFRDTSFDVCVVGAGPAGIVVSRALAKHGLTVGLFEAGGEKLTPESQDVYVGDIVGERYWPLEIARLRYFGGSSNHWGGFCRELDAFDFKAHAANPRGGWPITKIDLDPYATETDTILDLPPRSAPPPYLPKDIVPFERIDFRFSPVRFGKKFRGELAQSQRIKLYLNANLVDIVPDHSRRRIAEFRFRSFDREGSFAVAAKRYILCLGGIENPRLLLNCQRGDRFALGNEHDLVGRYFAEHLHYTLGDVLYEKPLSERLFVGPTATLLERPQTLNFGLRLEPPPSAPPGAQSKDCVEPFSEKLAKAIEAPADCIALGKLRIASEQALDRDSRVLLTGKLDRFGLRRVALDWKISPVDRWSIQSSAMEWAALMAKQRLGRVRLKAWVLDATRRLPLLGLDEVIGKHHLCTTKMSDDPRAGVVDKNCRVHGVENLYIGGSSVFASGGASNPTYTIVQLALRLADHLRERARH